HISQFYLAHVFKEMSGYSPIQYMIRRRIGEAQTLLISTDKTILEISELVGYESQSHFNFHFSKNIGMPPNQFRRSFVLGRTARRRQTGRQSARASQQRIMEN
ncbi:MAG: helix-turn-helix transcriptional regulator, partial [Lachnospiraceae bacterium]|nr:helix-turn-helix transcriptional regulator [Lachnospiraceae bacterium]